MLWLLSLVAYQIVGTTGLLLFRSWLRTQKNIEPNLAGSYDWAWQVREYGGVSPFWHWRFIRTLNPLCLTAIISILGYQRLRTGHPFLSKGDCPQLPNCSNYAVGALFRMPFIVALKQIKKRVDNCCGDGHRVLFESSVDTNTPITAPPHVGLIMDGNRRWAKESGESLSSAYARAASNLTQIVHFFRQYGTNHLTLFAFSKENSNRSESDQQAVLSVFSQKLLELHDELQQQPNDLKIQFIGDLSLLDSPYQCVAQAIEEETKEYNGLVLTIAFNYSGRSDIVEAFNAPKKQSKLTESSIKRYFATKDLPDIDLVVRTGGNQRLSNFLIWETAYSELFFSETLFPDLNWFELATICSLFSRQQRNFGI